MAEQGDVSELRAAYEDALVMLAEADGLVEVARKVISDARAKQFRASQRLIEARDQFEAAYGVLDGHRPPEDPDEDDRRFD